MDALQMSDMLASWAHPNNRSARLGTGMAETVANGIAYLYRPAYRDVLVSYAQGGTHLLTIGGILNPAAARDAITRDADRRVLRADKSTPVPWTGSERPSWAEIDRRWAEIVRNAA